MKDRLHCLAFSSSKTAWICFLPLILYAMVCLVGFNGLYGQDSFEYLRYSRALHSYITGGDLPGAFHWPVLYPLAGALLSFVLPDIIALQVTAIAFYGLTILLIHKILQELYPERNTESSLLVLLFFSLSPFVLRYSSSVMSDAMCLFFLVAFFYSFLRFTTKDEKWHFSLLILWACAAVNTRYASVAVIIFPLLAAIILFFKKFDFRFLALSLLLGFSTFLPALLLRLKGNSIYQQMLVPEWSPVNIFRRSFSTIDGTFIYTWPNACFVFSNLFYPGFIFTGLLFLLMTRRKDIKRSSFISMTGIALLCYALLLAGLPTQNHRFLLLTFPLVLLIYAGAFFRLCDFILKNFKPHILFLIIAAIVLSQLWLSFRAFQPFYRNSKVTKEIAMEMKKYPGKTIYTFNMDMALKAYHVENKIINLWAEKITMFYPKSLVLFNYLDSYRQWKGRNPMINWESMNRTHHLKLIHKLPGNWNLYEIEN